MSKMKRSDQERFRGPLKELGGRIQSDSKSISEQAHGASGGQASGDLSNVPMHLADMGTDEFLYDMNSTVLENEAYLAGEIAAAIQRIDNGLFGTCEECAETIPKERLQALPYARYCVHCAEKLDSGSHANLNRGRPVGPRDTLAPEGRMNEDRSARRNTGITAVDVRRTSGMDRGDQHAIGTAGGGTALGGLAGSNSGHGDPDVSELEDATGSSSYDARGEDDLSEMQGRNEPSHLSRPDR